ncbi:hypothetical protein [Amycolatopsis sp. H20-H5]|uniref:hypothetical protein n=1 Tax=Amycolatopsis sp. H20-H5 TaxID=3046309 RepID=UPI002DB838A9|nr:hypothetical protein [Amycolatopsis sp. H20-H5]MEC3975338.1 hypothetical protein [Amycolatopsis sp. H20-H5]
MTMLKKVASGVVITGALLTGAGLTAGQASAQEVAKPALSAETAATVAANCQYNESYVHVSALLQCDTLPAGVSEFRLRIKCTTNLVFYGPWRGRGGGSAAGCTGGGTVAAWGVDVR